MKRNRGAGSFTPPGALRLAVLACLLLTSLTAPAPAAKTPERPQRTAPTPGLTVEELVHETARALSSGAWQAAVEHCNALLRDFDDRPETAHLRARAQLTLLRCYLQMEQWTEAAPLFETALGLLAAAPPAARAELLLQKTACELRLSRQALACKSISDCLQLLPAGAPIHTEALLLQATCLLTSGRPAEAGALLETVLDTLDHRRAHAALQSGMQAFLEANQPGRACTLFSEAVRKSPGLAENIGTQTVLLQVGSKLLEQAEPAAALACLRYIPQRERLLAAQRRHLAFLETAPASKQMQSATHQYEATIPRQLASKLRAELEAFGNGEAFAAVTQVQLAAAYQALGRLHEAALVLEETTRRLSPSETLESAMVDLAGVWMQLERWEKVSETAAQFASSYPESKHKPLMLYLRGCAEQKAGRFAQALESFHALSQDHKGHELVASARFMEAFTLLLNSQPGEAGRRFAAFLATHKKHELAEPSAHWLCAALTQSAPPALVRAAADAYLADFPAGENRSYVRLRRAQALHALGDRKEAVPELEKLLSSEPEHPCAGEAALLLGDDLLFLGETAGALAAWQRVPQNLREAREEALLKSARVLYRAGRAGELREVLRDFDGMYADSPRLVEVAGWLRKAFASEGSAPDVDAWIFERILLQGNNPEAPGMDLLLAAAAVRLNTGDEKKGFRARLQQLNAAALEAAQPTLSSRLKWAAAKQLSASDAAEAGLLFVEAASLAPPAGTSPAVLADGAAALEAAGRRAEAFRLWRELLRWHPCSQEIDRAFCALAAHDFEAQRFDSAQHWISRFEKAAPGSPLLSQVLLLKARLLRAGGKPGEAHAVLEQLLREKTAGAASKCEALYLTGEMHLEGGNPRLAIPYLQRVYVSYGRRQPWAARAYIASGEAFVTLGDLLAARNTFQELLSSGLALEAADKAAAAERLKTLGGAP
jgi:tetratricopeptide (TPR) repeat protein